MSWSQEFDQQARMGTSQAIWSRGCLRVWAYCLICVALLGAGCRRESTHDREALISVYGFSVLKEPLEKEIFPAYRDEWARKTGQELTFAASFAGSEMVTNQIISGVGADVAILAIERNADRLTETRTTMHRWRELPHAGIVHESPMVILVQKGNPFRIREFSDLGRARLRLIHCDPIASGAGQWSLLAVYGAELRKIERREGRADPAGRGRLHPAVGARGRPRRGSSRPGPADRLSVPGPQELP